MHLSQSLVKHISPKQRTDKHYYQCEKRVFPAATSVHGLHSLPHSLLNFIHIRQKLVLHFDLQLAQALP